MRVVLPRCPWSAPTLFTWKLVLVIALWKTTSSGILLLLAPGLLVPLVHGLGCVAVTAVVIPEVTIAKSSKPEKSTEGTA